MQTGYDLKIRSKNAVKEMTYFARKFFNLPQLPVPEMRLSLSTHRRRSYGGARIRNGRVIPRISIQLLRYSYPHKTYFSEYAKLARSKTIGNFTAPDSWYCTLAVLAHEVAHGIEHYVKFNVKYANALHIRDENAVAGNCLTIDPNFVSTNEFDGHGKTWQYIYHVLREQFVNPFVQAHGEVVKPEIQIKEYPPIIPPIKPIIPLIVPTTYSGSTNIAKVCNMYKQNYGAGDHWLLNEIVRMLGVTRSNASIYLKKARERCN